MGARINPTVARKLFSGLWLHLRESDFVGWYREERVAGAVLTELGDAPETTGCRLVSQRISGVLRECLPASIARRLQVRVYEHPSPRGIESLPPSPPPCRADLILEEI